jgi:hypothetical protein
LAGLVLVPALASAAIALDEAQIHDVTCAGLRVTQRGLPASQQVEVELVDTRHGRELAAKVVRTDAAGRLDVRLAADLRGVPQVLVEVKIGSSEYGEAGADLPQPCSASPGPPVLATAPPVPTSGTPPVATLSAAPSAQAVPSSPAVSAGAPSAGAAAPDREAADSDSRLLMALAALAAVAAAGAAAVAVRRRSRT